MEKISDVVIIGAGISGLSAAHFVKKLLPASAVMLLETSDRAGGAIQSFAQEGFLAEWGPHGFLDNAAESREILEDTGLYSEAQQAPLGDFHRYVCHRGRLVQIPQKPAKVLFTPLLPWWGKIRVLGDLWIRPEQNDQTLGQWAARRFGKSVLPLIDAAVTGSFSGDYNLLSIDAVMPGLRKLELEHGSVIRALLKKMKEKKGSIKERLPAMNNFPQGLERLVEVMAKGKNIVYGSGVSAIARVNGNWRLTTAQGEVTARNVIMALPVNSGLRLLADLKKPPLAAVPVSRICNVVLGYDAGGARVPYGFGYLAPECEKRFTLGVLFSSHMFPNRAPAGRVLLEALVGGRRHPERLELSDEEMIAAVCRDIGQLLELPAKPLFAKVLRPASAIPQLEMDHPKLLAYRAALEQENAGLYICGFGWDGVGINDMVKAARKAAAAISAGGRGEEGAAPVKPVYF
jgi:oxygen-dependent protoporphyrinogen oxidase